MRISQGLRAAAGNLSSSGAWDLASASFTGTPVNYLYTGSQDSALRGLFFKDDGTKMYTTGAGSDRVYEYSLSTAWDIATVSYVHSFSVSAQTGSPGNVFFKDDGTKMYVVAFDNDTVSEYNLSTAWNISTASYLQNFSVTTQETSPFGLFFKSDGTKMYILGSAGDDVNEYNLSTAWNISTASYVQVFSVATEDTAPFGLFFKSDGTKMYITGDTGNEINEYSLSTAWNVSTASYVRVFSVNTQNPTPYGLFFKSDGTKMYVGSSQLNVYQYSLSTAWDISTASFSYPTTNYFSVAAQDNTPEDLYLSPDGTKMYVVGGANRYINEYTLSTAWSISTASYVQNFSTSTQDLGPVGIFFKSDGTKMYMLGTANDKIYEYSLSTAWNISTASYVQNFSIATQSTDPQGIFFNSDGTKLYMVSRTVSTVYQYDLSTAWDISTTSYIRSFGVSTQDSGARGVFFKDDGTKMYIVGTTTDTVYQYDLSTAWNISTASYIKNFAVFNEDTGPLGLFFRDNGTKLYIVGSVNDAVWSYDL